MRARIRHYSTKYYGVYIQAESEDAGRRHWWVADATGCDVYFGQAKPTAKDVDRYVEERH